MMTRDKIVQLEHNRLNNLNMVYLIKDNNNWYKAYEWSAYLLEFYPKSNAKKPLKANKKIFKDVNQELAYVSLQMPSLEKFAPDTKYNKESQEDVIPIIVDLSLYTDINVLEYKDILTKWKNSFEIEVPEPKQKQSTNVQSEKKVYKSSEIEQKILGFQYYNIEKDDLIKFIMDLKNMCASRI